MRKSVRLLLALVLIELVAGGVWTLVVHWPGRGSIPAASMVQTGQRPSVLSTVTAAAPTPVVASLPTSIVASDALPIVAAAPAASIATAPPVVATALPAAVVAAAPPPAVAAALPAVVVAAEPTPAVAAALPAVVVAAAPPPAVPNAADEWQRLQPELDRAWASDPGRTVELLAAFLQQYPDHEVAQEKLYAALLAEAVAHTSQDAPALAVDVLQRAERLLPDRAEAGAQLRALTPTPIPEPAATAAPQQNAPRAPAPPVREQPAPAPAPASRAPRSVAPAPIMPSRPQSPPTPTKAPFRPPGS